MIFGVIDTNKAGRVAEFCDVDPESAKLELRILTKGGTRCEQYIEPESLVFNYFLYLTPPDRFRNERNRPYRQEELCDSAQSPYIRSYACRQVQIALHRDHVSLRAPLLRLLHPGRKGRRGLRRTPVSPFPR